MITRITDQMVLAKSQANLQTQLSQLSVLQNESSSQQAITKPSDNPTGMAMSLALKSQQAANAQYANNASDALNWLTTANSSLTSATTALQSVRSLVVQASNTGALSTSAQAAIVAQLQSLKGELLTQANTTYLGRPVFAGNSDAGGAFDDSTYSYNGTPGTTVSRTIGQGVTVQASADGAATFGTGTNSVFALIDTITSDIQSGTNPSSLLTNVDASISALTTEQSAISASYTAVQAQQTSLTAQAASLTTQRSSVDNIDLTKTLVQLTAQQNAYQAALGVTSKALQPTLMSFLS